MKVDLYFPEPPRALPLQDRLPKLTVLLVLGHAFEQLIARGLVKDYTAIGRITGLSRARVTQIANLTLLAPPIQEEILATDRSGRLHTIPERLFRSLLVHSDWSEQRRLLSKLVRGRPTSGCRNARSAKRHLKTVSITEANLAVRLRRFSEGNPPSRSCPFAIVFPPL